ncbi:MAG: ABC transporter ATP-binding protein [Thermoprotei archaeon]
MGASRQRAVELRGVSVRYGAKTVLREVSWVFPIGEAIGILGPNGAGKTTILRTIVGVVHPYEGWVKVFELDAGSVEAKRLIGYLPERPGVYERLSAIQNMLFHAQLNGLDASSALDRSKALLEEFGLWGVAHERVQTFSKGMKQRLALAKTLLTDPPLLLLDEPTSGLDPDGANLLVQLLKERLEHDHTIILSTHNPYFARRLCTDALIVSGGRIMNAGSLESLVFQQRVRIRLLTPISVGVINTLLGDGYTPIVSRDGEASEFELPVSSGE